MTIAQIQPRSLGDLVAMTKPDFGPMRFTEIATDLQRHTALSELLVENRVVPEGGKYIEWRVMVNDNGAARNVPLGYSDDVDINETMVVANTDWRNSTTNYGIIGQELAMNSSSAKIIDLEQERRIASMISLASLMESNFWGPPVVLTDTVTPLGVNTWIVKNATEGFNGGAPSGYTEIGLNPTTYPRWKNYTFQYTDFSPEDFVRKLSRAATKSHFMPPVQNIPSTNTGDNYKFYASYDVIGPLQELLRASNENLGPDIDAFAGKVQFRGSVIQWVPKLDADTTQPIYWLNWGEFKTYVLPGWWLKQTYVPQVPGQHTTSANHVDCTYCPVVKNRRGMGVGATGTTYPG